MRAKTIITSALLLSFHLPLIFAEDSWSSFQNGGQPYAREGHLPLKWNVSEGITWTTPLDGYGQSSPVIWNDAVYVTFCSGDNKENLHIRSVALGSGNTNWEHKFANASPEEASNYVSKAAPTPVVDADGVVAFFEGGNLIALEHDGSVRWQRDLVKEYGAIAARHGLGASLEHDEQWVYVWVERTEEPYVLAADKKTGETKWKVPGVGATAWSSPRLVPVDGEQHLVLSASGRIVGLDPATGKQLWKFEDIASNTTCTPMPLGKGRFLIGASEGRGEESAAGPKSCGVIGIERNEQGEFSARYVWRSDKATSSFGSPIAADGNAYFVNRSGVVYCLDLESGEQHYAQRTDSSTWATPIHCDDRIYLFGRSGTTTVLATGDKFKVLAENPLWKSEEAAEGAFGSVLYAAAVADGKCVLRRGDRLYCVATNGD